jgi:hypothetical protein
MARSTARRSTPVENHAAQQQRQVEQAAKEELARRRICLALVARGAVRVELIRQVEECPIQSSRLGDK